MSAEIEVMKERGRVEVCGELDYATVAAAIREIRKIGPHFRAAVLEVHPQDFDEMIANANADHDLPKYIQDDRMYDEGGYRMFGLVVLRQLARPRGTFGVRTGPRIGTNWDRHHMVPAVITISTVASSIQDPRPAFSRTALSGDDSRVGVPIITPPALAWGRAGKWFAALHRLHPDTGRQAVAVLPIELPQLELLYGPAPIWVDTDAPG
jgi:hypothetical protein